MNYIIFFCYIDINKMNVVKNYSCFKLNCNLKQLKCKLK